jgi:D-alanyl-D-alanine dipeptidase
MPPGFVYLSDVAPDIVQDMRYHTAHNFIGRPIAGYDDGVCILTEKAARALAHVERSLLDAGLTLRVYDCYRPQRAVDEFVAWSKIMWDQRMKVEFYPRVDKSELLALGYLAARSGHTRGSTLDLTIQRVDARTARPYEFGKHSCIAPWAQRYHDGSIDMGTSFDCMDELSHSDADVGAVAGHHRRMLADLMERYGFVGIRTEWWHFTLADEPFRKTYFDFPVRASASATPAGSGSHGRSFRRAER